jgi:threonine synthase
VVAVRALKLPASTTVCLATAHPAKFEEAVELAIEGRPYDVPGKPRELSELFDLPTRTTLLPAELAEIEAFVASRLPPPSTSGGVGGVGVGLGWLAVGGVALGTALIFMFARRK